MSDSHRSITPPTNLEIPEQTPLGNLLLEIFEIRPPLNLERSTADRKLHRVLVVLIVNYVTVSLCISYRAWISPIVWDLLLTSQVLVCGWAIVSVSKYFVRSLKNRQMFFRELAQDVAEMLPQSYQMVLRLKAYPREELLVARREYDRASTGVAERTSALKMSDLPQAALLLFGYLAAQITGWVQTIPAPAWRYGAFSVIAVAGIVYLYTFLLDLNLKMKRHRFLRIVDLLDEAIAAQKREEELAKDAAKKAT